MKVNANLNEIVYQFEELAGTAKKILPDDHAGMADMKATNQGQALTKANRSLAGRGAP